MCVWNKREIYEEIIATSCIMVISSLVWSQAQLQIIISDTDLV